MPYSQTEIINLNRAAVPTDFNKLKFSKNIATIQLDEFLRSEIDKLTLNAPRKAIDL